MRPGCPRFPPSEVLSYLTLTQGTLFQPYQGHHCAICEWKLLDTTAEGDIHENAVRWRPLELYK